MAISVEKTGRTVEEAVALALSELNVDEDQVDIDVLEEGSKGIFGIIGAKMARVKVTVREQASDKVKEYLDEIFEKMDVNVQISEVREDNDTIYVIIEGEDSGIIIGRRGETLDALQYLCCLAINNGGDYKRVIIDTENYRKKREETLIRLSHKLADKVLKSKKSITLEPMTPYERRIIHEALQNNKYVKTYSIGEEPNRKVVIALK